MENEAIRYDQYRMKLGELVLNLLMAMGFFFLVGMIFYDHLVISLVLSLLGITWIPGRKRELARKRKELVKLQFKDALYFISVSLSTGKSFETALIDAQQALERVYPDKNALIIKELELINARVMMNMPVEQALADFADRVQLEEVKNFSDVFSISKRAGANLVEVIKNTSNMIREKIEVKQEIENLVAGKKLEQKILNLTPFVLVFVIKSSSSGFLDPLFTTAAGRVVMTVALLLMLIGNLISKKIMNIEV
ncbi:MAG: pilus assembly protein TadB [Clostridiaceae bacterium]|nr:pilus assembly protein TadB [Clostridiaceae bacterium]